MQIPRILSKPSSSLLRCGGSSWEKNCDGCPFNDICIQCNANINCRQTACYRDCGNCGGSALDKEVGRVIETPAVCVKSPLRDLFFQQVKKDKYHFKKRGKIKLKKDSIIVTQGSAGSRFPLYPSGTAAVAVNIRHVWSRAGWYSRDMRDYLQIEDKKTKVILLTTTLDDVLERAWASEVYNADFAALGFDYWHSLDFSEYDDMGRCHNLWTGYRTLYGIEKSGSHFSFVPPAACNRESVGPGSVWQKLVTRVPNIYVHLQWVRLSGKNGNAVFKRALAPVVRWLRSSGVDATLWFVGVSSSNMAYNLKRLFFTYDCYFLSVNPWLAAHKGNLFSKEGKLLKSKLPKSELVLQNQRHYENLISRAVEAARTTGKST